MSQAVYWSSTLPTERDGWFYKSATEWEAETGMTESEQQTARKRLRNIGVWDEKQHPSSLNRSKWFRVDMEKLIELIVSHSANPGYANQESAGCYTETTAEIPYKREARKPRASRSEKRPWIPLGPDEEKPGHKLLAQVISVPDKG